MHYRSHAFEQCSCRNPGDADGELPERAKQCAICLVEHSIEWSASTFHHKYDYGYAGRQYRLYRDIDGTGKQHSHSNGVDGRHGPRAGLYYQRNTQQRHCRNAGHADRDVPERTGQCSIRLVE